LDFTRWALHRREATPRGARYNRNRLQANIVSAAGGKTSPTMAPVKARLQPRSGEWNLAVGAVRNAYVTHGWHRIYIRTA